MQPEALSHVVIDLHKARHFGLPRTVQSIFDLANVDSLLRLQFSKYFSAYQLFSLRILGPQFSEEPQFSEPFSNTPGVDLLNKSRFDCTIFGCWHMCKVQTSVLPPNCSNFFP